MSEEILKKRIKETHDSEWIRFSGIHSLLAIALPILSEFEGIGEDLALGIGGAGAASVFAMLMKIGRVTAVVSDLQVEQDELHACLLYTSPSPRDRTRSRMPSSA